MLVVVVESGMVTTKAEISRTSINEFEDSRSRPRTGDCSVVPWGPPPDRRPVPTALCNNLLSFSAFSCCVLSFAFSLPILDCVKWGNVQSGMEFSPVKNL